MTQAQIEYIRRVLAGRQAERILAPPVLEAFSPEAEARQEKAAVALETIHSGGRPAPADLAVLEAIVMKEGRPVWNVKNDSFAAPGPDWPQVETARPRIETAIKAIGRIDLAGHPSMPYGGTAFIVGPGLLMTNRHVAELFASGGGMRAEFRSGITSSIDFKQEPGSDESVRLKVASVRIIHPYWDCALLRVDGLDGARPQLTVLARKPDNLAGRDVVVIGFPGFNPDPSQNPSLQIKIFEGIFQKKRLQPGTAMGHPFAVESFGKVVEALAHDCSTLGGNSGSAVIDLETGCVLALHFSGAYLLANYSVPGWELALDSRLADEGVRFKDRPAVFDKPGWLEAWNTQEHTAAPVPVPTVAPAPLQPSVDWLRGDWYERVTDAEIARALTAAPSSTNAFVEAATGAPLPISTFATHTAVDESLPEIVLLPCLFGSHLDAEERVWLSAGIGRTGTLARRLNLKSAGPLKPTQHVRLLYEPAIRAWKAQGFRVHPFPYDWRWRLSDTARCLDYHIESLKVLNPNARFAFVAHGLGGLVACAWSLRSSIWAASVSHAVLAGVPLAGSFVAVEALLGSLPFFRNLALLNPSNDLDELRAMAATFPAWTAMLPDPSLFNEANRCYSPAFWPDGIAPPRADLDESRNWKRDVRQSPLLRRSLIIASSTHATPSGLNGEITGGDGVVTMESALPPETTALSTSSSHFEMFNSAEVFQAAGDFFSGRVPALSELELTTPSGLMATPEAVGEPLVPEELIEQRLSSRSLQWLIG